MGSSSLSFQNPARRNMPQDTDTVEVQEKVIRIVAAKGTTRIIEYEVNDADGPGFIPNWFIGVVLLLRDEIEDDEKIVIHEGVIKIVKKTPIDKFLEWVKSLKWNIGEVTPGYDLSCDRPVKPS